MSDNLLYQERVSSDRTEALFMALTLLFLGLGVWRVAARRLDALAIVLFCFSALFVFYSVNYRTLIIRLTPERLKLTFGLFTWSVPLDNIEDYRLDELPIGMRLGGAGIHFMFIRKRYRASFNFLEYPRLVIAFKRPVGPVRDISFSTRRPEAILRLIQETLSAKGAVGRERPVQ